MTNDLPNPLILHLSLTNACNFRCTICPSMREDKKLDRPLMDTSLLDRICSEVLPHATTLILGGNSLGEVTTHREFPRFLSDTFNRDSSTELRLTTNGYRLGEFAAQIAEKFSFVSVSFDGATKKTYESIRRYPFEKIVGNIRKLADERTKRGTKLRIGLGMTLLYSNAGELPMLADLASDMGADLLVGSFFIPNFPSERYECLYYHQRYANDMADEAAERAARRGLEFRMPRFCLPGRELSEEEMTPAYMLCSLPFTMMNLSETGIVTPCCANPTVMGDLKAESLEDIWNGKRYRKFRADVGENLYCRICHTTVFGKHASTGVITDPSYQIKTIGSELPVSMAIRSVAFQRLNTSAVGRKVINMAKAAVQRK